MSTRETLTAFAGDRRIASGRLQKLVLETKAWMERGESGSVLIFEDWTGTQVDFDFRGTPDEVLQRALAPAARPGPGRPKLGVVCREVSLLPRHWDWLQSQPNGISAALRRLVDEARKRDPEGERRRQAMQAASRVMSALAGNLPGYEEATRALFADDRARVRQLTRGWPGDIRSYVGKLVKAADRSA
ncbi:MAG: DUF2239 family protein [Candidatus Wallbacteria bacterium]|nr:DUF2239 family protein [Candidatus Wallbacteria bacterium]